MNDTPNTYTDMDSAKIAKLMAELHADAGSPDNGGDSEATPSEGAFVSEDDSAHPVSTN